MQFWTVPELEQKAQQEHGVGEEIAPGVILSRRRILQASLAGIACAAAVGCRSALPAGPASTGPSPDALSLDRLVAGVRPRARLMIASERPDEASYLAEVSRLLARYEPEEPWMVREIGEKGWSMNTGAWMPPVVVYDITMRPGSRIHLHDHRHYNGVLLCNEGSVRCRNFDIVQPEDRVLDVAAGEVPPAGEDFLIRQNKDSTLGPGQIATLARDRDNIHHVEAGPDGCSLTDVFTYFRREAKSHELEWDERPVSSGGDVYRVSWKG